MFVELASGVKCPKMTTVEFVLKRPFADVLSSCRSFFLWVFSVFGAFKGEERGEKEWDKEGCCNKTSRYAYVQKGNGFEKFSKVREERDSTRQILAQTRRNQSRQVSPPEFCTGGRQHWKQYALGLIRRQRTGADRQIAEATRRTSGIVRLIWRWVAMVIGRVNYLRQNLGQVLYVGWSTVRFELVRESWLSMGLEHLKSLPIWGGSRRALVFRPLKVVSKAPLPWWYNRQAHCGVTWGVSVPDSRVATYKQSYTTRHWAIRHISLRCDAGARRAGICILKTASLLHGNKVSKLICKIQILSLRRGPSP